ncbi:MAG: eukaryotic-like serine/threonine-protein kinase [Gaiellaceae bacterium]|nr:eukaryotic-like serine/threonine-protein kinase [Gaiellaceae bacterium]
MPETVIAGRYRLHELLGRSGMSEVWRAEDLELGRDVAIKLLAADADRERFEREARAVASLAHPNVMQLYDYGESEGRPYMVLEYVPGGTLEDRLRDGGPLPDDETYEIAIGIASGLAHAHARGVVHRDLKPANVLFDEEGRPKIADFGIARLAAGEGTLTEAGTLLGTAAYISPEQASGEPAGAASDVYSFGVMLYRMLAGRLPFASNDPMELVLMHRDTPPPPLTQFRTDAPPRLESTAMLALSKDPSGRPRDGTALLAELGVPTGGGFTTATAVLPDDQTQVLPVAPGAGPPDPGPPPFSRRIPLIVAALFLLAVAGGALAYEVTRPASSPTPGTFTATTQQTRSTRHSTTTAPSTAPSTESTTQQSTTQQTTAPPTTQPTQPTTTATPPTTTAPPPTTTAPPTPDTTATTGTTAAGVTVTAP